MFVELLFRSWERIGVDFFIFDIKDFFVIVDYFSNYWGINKFNNILASVVVLKLKSYFVRYRCFD